MCRWIAWSGAPRFLEELISVPEHSLIRQSRQALAAKTPVNADGFGIAWYGFRPEPCLYKDIHPAWSDPNLQQLAHHARASLFMAHVRASTGAATTYNNSHPFAHGRWAFMHNGQVGGYDRLRKTIDGMIPDELYGNRRGATDSEALFLIALGLGLADEPVGAMAQAVFRLEEMARRLGALPHMRFAACWTDGSRLFAARYASDQLAPSVYYRNGLDGVTVVSEPLDDCLDDWTELPQGSLLLVEGEPRRIVIRPFGRASDAGASVCAA